MCQRIKKYIDNLPLVPQEEKTIRIIIIMQKTHSITNEYYDIAAATKKKI